MVVRDCGDSDTFSPWLKFNNTKNKLIQTAKFSVYWRKASNLPPGSTTAKLTKVTVVWAVNLAFRAIFIILRCGLSLSLPEYTCLFMYVCFAHSWTMLTCSLSDHLTLANTGLDIFGVSWLLAKCQFYSMCGASACTQNRHRPRVGSVTPVVHGWKGGKDRCVCVSKSITASGLLCSGSHPIHPPIPLLNIRVPVFTIRTQLYVGQSSFFLLMPDVLVIWAAWFTPGWTVISSLLWFFGLQSCVVLLSRNCHYTGPDKHHCFESAGGSAEG